MPIRTRGRAKFDFRGRAFVWWIDNDKYLRIASLDKKFVIALLLGADVDAPGVVEVTGQEFPGLDQSERRPVRLVVPWPEGKSMGACVDELLRWSFDPGHALIRFNGPVRFF